ncbi:MAG TPA: PLDc N-terminal domain-containing protein [Candidatus Nanoarchaeia archaeon]|nr:PLDc N-terminal domain-containing protein [Candidatus Nanoarchaeia archaeon]
MMLFGPNEDAVMMFFGPFGIVGLICAVWVIYDIVTYQKKMEDLHKIIWIICALLFSIVTAIVYYFVVKDASGKMKH